MSLKLKIRIEETKNSVLITECTGKYNGDNKGGWGLPNYTLSNVLTAQFEVYPPEVTSPIIISVYPDFPTDDNEIKYELLKSQLGLTSITSGTWKIGYRVSGEDSKGLAFERYTEVKDVFVKEVECCVDKLVAHTANIPMNVFMKDEKKKSAAELSVLLKDAKFAKTCGNFESAQNILKFIGLQCQCCS